MFSVDDLSRMQSCAKHAKRTFLEPHEVLYLTAAAGLAGTDHGADHATATLGK